MVIKIAHKHNVPIIVDAATENPPKKSLRQFIEIGVDLVVLSGGKEVRGPNNSGILAGRRDLIKLAHLQAYPFHGVGRHGKMSREAIVGFVTALKLYVAHDEEAVFRARVVKARWISEQLNKIPNVRTEMFYMTTVLDNEPMVPLVGVQIDEKAFGITGKDLSDRLMTSDPKIYAPYESRFLGPNSAGTLDVYNGKVTINPRGMLEGDEEIVVDKIKEILTVRKIQPIRQK
jgi:L-seryl-tRNA(Ser) seleniumtransferase